MYGEFFPNNLGLSQSITEPEIVSHLEDKDFYEIKKKIPTPPTFLESTLNHEYSESCD